jgi:hypothetical protein
MGEVGDDAEEVQMYGHVDGEAAVPISLTWSSL